MDHNLMIPIPAAVYNVCKNPSLNWNYFSEPEPDCHGREKDLRQAYTMTVDQLRPKSCGEIKLYSADPADRPPYHFKEKH